MSTLDASSANRPGALLLCLAKLDAVGDPHKLDGLVLDQHLLYKSNAIVVRGVHLGFFYHIVVVGLMPYNKLHIANQLVARPVLIDFSSFDPFHEAAVEVLPLLFGEGLHHLINDNVMQVVFVGLFSMLGYQPLGELFQRIEVKDIVKEEHPLRIEVLGQRVDGCCLMAKSTIHRNVPVKVDTSQVPMKMIRDCSLKAINEPVTRAIVLVSELCAHLCHISVLHSCQILVVTQTASIHNHGRVTLVTEAYQEVLVLILEKYDTF